jgi:hypothetical protein
VPGPLTQHKRDPRTRLWQGVRLARPSPGSPQIRSEAAREGRYPNGSATALRAAA